MKSKSILVILLVVAIGAGVAIYLKAGKKPLPPPPPAPVAQEAPVTPPAPATEGPTVHTGNVAMVNDNPLTAEAFDREMARIQERFLSKSPLTKEQRATVEQQVLDILIGGELLYQESKKKGIAISDEALETQFEAIKARYQDEKKFNVNFTKDDIRQKMAIQQFIKEEFFDTAIIADEDSRKYYDDHVADFTKPEQVKASHILIKADAKATPEEKEAAHATILVVQKKLQEGGDFAALAKEYSQDGSAAAGGDLGLFSHGQMVAPFEQAAFALNVDEVSEVVETQFGYHLIKTTEKKPSAVVAYEEVVDKLKEYLRQEQVQSKVGLLVKELKEKAQIKNMLTPANG